MVRLTDNQKRSYAFVLPRYGPGCGGAENLSGALARKLAKDGNYVEVLTTCARDNRSWENELPAGATIEDGLVVNRFPVNDRDLECWIPKQISISEGMNLPVEDQLDWMAESVNSIEMYDYIVRHENRFNALIFAPYLFGTTFWGAQLFPNKSYLLSCLHDEHYAYTDVMQSLFRRVGGALFNATGEQELANKLYGDIPGGVVGMGFVPPAAEEVAKLTPYFKEDFPYLLYLGRKETGKNVQGLIDCFTSGKEFGLLDPELKLVIAGPGSFDDILRPEALERDDIIDVEQLTEEEKQRVLKHAVALCQPSLMESFSIVIMEAWMVGTPVLVHADCTVTRAHVTESGGGLYFCDEVEFAAVVTRLAKDKGLSKELAQSGLDYVKDVYSWDAVLGRFYDTFDALLDG